MALAKIRDWLEIVGLFSVVLSLVFVGLQIKQSQDIALAAQYQARADHNLQLAAMQFENDEFMQAVGSSARDSVVSLIDQYGARRSITIDDVEGSPDDLLGRVVTRCAMAVKQMENIHYQWQLGLIDDDNWRAFKAQINRYRGGVCGPFFDAVPEREWLPQRFRTLMSEIRESSPSA